MLLPGPRCGRPGRQAEARGTGTRRARRPKARTRAGKRRAERRAREGGWRPRAQNSGGCKGAGAQDPGGRVGPELLYRTGYGGPGHRVWPWYTGYGKRTREGAEARGTMAWPSSSSRGSWAHDPELRDAVHVGIVPYVSGRGAGGRAIRRLFREASGRLSSLRLRSRRHPRDRLPPFSPWPS